MDVLANWMLMDREERWGEHREIWYRLLRQRVVEHV